MSRKPIEVVAGIIVREGRILLTQRRHDKALPNIWNTPGGKVDGLHESQHDALRRELREEIGIDVGRLDEEAIWSGYVGELFVLFFFLVREWTGYPRPMEGQGLGWFTEAEMMALGRSPADVEATATLVRAIRATVFHTELTLADRAYLDGLLDGDTSNLAAWLAQPDARFRYDADSTAPESKDVIVPSDDRPVGRWIRQVPT